MHPSALTSVTPFASILVLLILTAVSIGESLVFPPYGHSYGIRKATPKHLFMFFGPQTFFEDPQGLATVKMKSRDDPSTKKDDDEVVVYGVNSGRHELIYNTSMWALALYGTRGSGKGQFLFPKGVAADPEGNVYVADSGNNRIVHLFNPKKEVHWVNSFDGKSAQDPGLKGPMQVGVTSDGDIYVSDRGNHRIVRFDNTGNVLQTIPHRAQTVLFEDGPSTLAVADGRDKWSHFDSDRFFVCADRGGKRLWKITFDGKVEKKIDMPSGHTAFYAAFDYYHNVWITDKHKHCILKFDRNLKLLDVFGSHGSGDNQFIEPRGITIWKRFGQTFIAERKGAQYYWVGTDLRKKGLTANADKSYTLSLDLAEYSFVSLFKVTGTDTTYALRKRFVYPGSTSTIFHDEKKTLKDGNLILRVEPTYSSYTFSKWDFPIKLGN